MAELVVTENVTLDGVMQAPGGAQEDTRGGFDAGGWATPYSDEVAMAEARKGMSTSAALLLGRRTYEHFYGYWPKQTDGNPFTDALNKAQKYVVSTTMTSAPWQNSTIMPNLDGIAELKASLDGDLVVLGSGELVRSLGALVDRVVLSIHPLVLGKGRRLELPAGELRLASSVPTGTGVIIATYVRTTS
ncbi:dihydrofolate reductase family protein [Actinophytocola oryzae]|uniref:Dihydrofolate reductase n=1 Tax=Actinophytocola oryzae TaxID=502181 RepID=A0A4R7UT16_9PSEU|nr:dihydrofolate reductase family protein [Actinophytocola oryzae]TDV37606.1 dihydrofolate reductase [Actinophytocola oryzae]